MKASRTISILIFMAVSMTAAMGDEVSYDAAAAYARAFFAGGQQTGPGSVKVKPVEYKSAGAQSASATTSPCFYVFNNSSGKGFVIIAGDDSARPVLAYSEDGQFKAEDMPDNVAEWMESLERQVNYLKGKKAVKTAAGDREWAAVKTAGWNPKPIVELKTALWNQSEPYDWQTPTIGGARCVTGCVQTAIAILMQYYEYPNGPIRNIDKGYYLRYEDPSYYYSKTVPASTSRYSWSNMPEDYSGGYTTAQGNAVATLMADLGVMQEAVYNTSSTGAYSFDAGENLAYYMGYTQASHYRKRDYYSTSEWTSMLRADLDLERPILYSGQSNSGGHCFIVDGYAANDYFHINWGWGGMCNGYFAIDVFQSDEQGIGGNKDGSAFAIGQDAIFGLVPDPSGTSRPDPQYIMSMGGMELYNTDAKISTSTQVGVRVTDLYNLGEATIQPVKLVMNVKSDKGYKEFLGVLPLSTEPLEQYYGYSELKIGTFTLPRVRVGDYIEMSFQRTGDAVEIPVSYNADRTRGVIPCIDAAFIVTKDHYSAGEHFEKKIFYGRELPVKVVWSVDGETSEGDIVLTSGRHEIKAQLTYALPGCRETLVSEITVE